MYLEIPPKYKGSGISRFPKVNKDILCYWNPEMLVKNMKFKNSKGLHVTSCIEIHGEFLQKFH